jgi:SAM-dependent methyltransferase
VPGAAVLEADAHDPIFGGPFDAVFPNAALHWMQGPETVAARIFAALRPGGRLVAEQGGHGNVAAIVMALDAAFDRRSDLAEAMEGLVAAPLDLIRLSVPRGRRTGRGRSGRARIVHLSSGWGSFAEGLEGPGAEEPDPKRVERHQGFMILSGCEARRNDECLGVIPPGANMRVGRPDMQPIRRTRRGR